MATSNYVVVTGASKGIGQATAIYLAQQGFHVFAGVRKAEDGKKLEAQVPGKLTAVSIDVTNQEQVAEAAQQVQAVVGSAGVAGLVNNAGVAVASPLEFLPLQELRNQLDVNVIGQLGVTQAFLPLLRQARGRVINIGSVGGRIAGPMLGAYHASKFAIEALTDTLRIELLPWGIDVICIEPGAVITPIWETSIERVTALQANYPPQAREYYGTQIDKRTAEAQKNSKQGIMPDRVAEVIHRALTAAKPRTRYLVGTDAKIAGTLITKLPDRWRDRLLR